MIASATNTSARIPSTPVESKPVPRRPRRSMRACFQVRCQFSRMPVDVEDPELETVSRYDSAPKPGNASVDYNDRVDDELVLQRLRRHGCRQERLRMTMFAPPSFRSYSVMSSQEVSVRAGRPSTTGPCPSPTSRACPGSLCRIPAAESQGALRRRSQVVEAQSHE